MSRIIELRVENYRRVKAVEIRPDGSLVVISGKNGEGKSSVLFAIWTALKGRAVAGPMPIRQGAESCTIKCQTEELTVTRSFTRTDTGEFTTEVKLVTKDGRRLAKPQSVLDSLIPDLALDPLDFMRRDARKQVDTIKALVGNFNFDANERERKDAFEARTIENRRAKEAVAAANGIQLPAGPEPEEIDVAALLDEIQKGHDHNAAIEARKTRRAAAQAEIDRLNDEIERMQGHVAGLEKRLAEAEALPAPVDVAALRAKLAPAEQIKLVRQRFEARRRHEADAKMAQDNSAKLTQRIEALDADKAEAIAKAKLPVPGLSFSEETLSLDGIPFEQASLAQKLRASVAIGIALSQNKDGLRVMTVDEASELDSHSMQLLAELAEKNDYQIWCAKVDESGEQGFVIEDGMVANAKG